MIQFEIIMLLITKKGTQNSIILDLSSSHISLALLLSDRTFFVVCRVSMDHEDDASHVEEILVNLCVPPRLIPIFTFLLRFILETIKYLMLCLKQSVKKILDSIDSPHLFGALSTKASSDRLLYFLEEFRIEIDNN